MQSFQRPENALKRANELLAIGQNGVALKILHNAIGHRRFRSLGWDSVQEAIMLRHVALCVDEGKLRLARDGLHQYRIISQHANIQSLGKVIGELRSRAEQKLAEAKAKIGDDVKISEALSPEDLDMEPETPELVFLSTLQIEVRSAEARNVHQALKAVWDVYKMVLDLLRTTPKLERVYHETARRAFAFCRDNRRHQEFKRLTEVLRSHFQLILKNRMKEDYESLLRPELHLETRMQQLLVASDLDLWRECSTTAEDIVNFGLHDYFHRCIRTGAELFHKSKERLLRWVAVYYEKMAKLMWVSESYLFHALAWIKFVLHVKGFRKNTEPEAMEEMTSIAVLAVLAIPNTVVNRHMEERGGDSLGAANVEQQKRLSALLGHGNVPTREAMTQVLQAKEILSFASNEVQQLFGIIEAEFTPLKLIALCQPLLETISANALFEPYVTPIKRVIFHKLIEQLSRVYTSLSIDSFTSDICPEEFLPWAEAEKLVVNLVYNQQQSVNSGSPSMTGSGITATQSPLDSLTIRIDYFQRAILFESSSAAAVKASRCHLVNLAKNMEKAVQMIFPGQSMEERIERKLFLENLGAKLASESARMAERMRVTNLKRLEKQEEQQKLEEERKRHEAEQRRVEEKQERDRRELASRKREERRQQEERIKARSETAALMLDEIKRIGKDSSIIIKGKHLSDINIDDVLQGHVNYDDLENAQRMHFNKERLNRVRQRRLNYRRVCHFIRACREEELPLLLEWQKDQLEMDTQILLAMQSKHEEEHKAAFAAALEEKRVFELVKPDKDSWVTEQLIEREEEYKNAAEEQRIRLLRKLKSMKLQRAKERREETLKKLRIEAERKRMEEEQKKYLEDLERSKQASEAEAAKRAKMLAKQQQREVEVEEKLRLQAKELQQEYRQQRQTATSTDNHTADTISENIPENRNRNNTVEDELDWRRGGQKKERTKEAKRTSVNDEEIGDWRNINRKANQPSDSQVDEGFTMIGRKR